MNTNSFEQVMRSISPLGVPRGNDFELISTFALRASDDFGAQIKTIQRYEEWARANHRDTTTDLGVDQVITTKNGEIWTVQNKGYGKSKNVPLAEMNNFIIKSENIGAARMFLVTSGPGLSAHANSTNRERGGPVIVLNRDWLRDATEYPETIEALRKAKPAPLEPLAFRDDQLEGIQACVGELRKRPETQLWRFCGTGKTIMGVGIADALGARTVGYFTPWLSLMQQSIHAVRRQHGDTPVTMVAVCSDDSIAKSDANTTKKKKKDSDHIEVNEQDLHVEVVHNKDELAKFVRERWDGKQRLIVFSTYASSQIVVDAQHQLDVPEFDFTFLDESHNIVGATTGEVAVGETVKRRDDGRDRLKSKYRVYATATPRQHSKKLRARHEATGTPIDSQDPESEVYGKVAQDYTIRHAIRDKAITDYRVYVVLVSKKEYEEMVRNRDMGTLADGTHVDLATYATHEAMRQAHDRLGSRRFITFHSRVLSAQNFASMSNRLGHLPHAEAVHGKMKTSLRNDLIKQLKEKPGILTNAQCLSEGVDIEALDTIVFTDPKSSVTDICQAIGRAVRNVKGKEFGNVIIPVVVPSDQYETGVISEEDLKTYTQNSNNPYQMVFRVIKALEEFDSAVAHAVTDMVFSIGPRPSVTGGSEVVEGGLTIDPVSDTVERDPLPGIPLIGEQIRLMGHGVSPEVLASFGKHMKLAVINRPRTNPSQREIGIGILMNDGYPQERATKVVELSLDDKVDEASKFIQLHHKETAEREARERAAKAAARAAKKAA